jgi:hypothetical protein
MLTAREEIAELNNENWRLRQTVKRLEGGYAELASLLQALLERVMVLPAARPPKRVRSPRRIHA